MLILYKKHRTIEPTVKTTTYEEKKCYKIAVNNSSQIVCGDKENSALHTHSFFEPYLYMSAVHSCAFMVETFRKI